MFLQAFSSLAAVSTIVNAGGDTYNIPVHILIALVIGFIVAFLTVSGMKAKLKSVEKRENAQEYVKQDSLRLSAKSDRFLYVKKDRREKPQNNNNS